MNRISVVSIIALLSLASRGGSAAPAPPCTNAPGKKVCGGTVFSKPIAVPKPNLQAACTVPGLWTTLFGSVTVDSDLTGTFTPPYCPQPLLLAITLQGSNTFTVRLTWTGDPGVCQSATESMAFASSDCNTVEGSYVNDDGSEGADSWQRTGPKLLLSRTNLTVVSAQGMPSGGSFSYASRIVSGTSVASISYASGVVASDNPNVTNLTHPANPNPRGVPSSGGLTEITASYATTKQGKTDQKFSVPTFGLSCYYTTSEVDWGTPPNACEAITINHQKYTGTQTNPLGLTGTYCSSFIAEVKLQGSAYTSDGRMIQYDPSTQMISQVSEIDGADGSQVVANRTLARDRAIIPRGVLVDIEGVGSGLEANDTGNAIRGYRIDLYKGSGSAVCNNFSNVIAIAACAPGNDSCPKSDLPQ